jgi:hypothetical protein
MTKPIHQQYHEKLRASQRLKPRSERRGELIRDMKHLIVKQLKIESRSVRNEVR